ncbi:MAG: nuclear transport factor 2 family protein [Dongiaceae bacterium]
MADEARIRAVLETLVQGIRAKDSARALRGYDNRAVFYDLAPPLRTVGPDRQGIGDWFGTWRGDIDYEITDLEISVSGDLAFAHGINRIGGTKTDGKKTSVWVRATYCLRRTGNDWKIVHEHVSVPFYMDGSVRAAIDLKP